MTEPQTLPQQDTQGESPLQGTPTPAPKRRRRHPRLTMSADLAELVAGDAAERGIPPDVALQRLGYSKRASKKATRHELVRMVQLRKIEEQGGTQDALAKVVVDALKADHVEVAKHEGQITDEKAYADHPTRLQARDRILELHGITTSRGQQHREADERPILNVQAGAKVQLVFFGEARDATGD